MTNKEMEDKGIACAQCIFYCDDHRECRQASPVGEDGKFPDMGYWEWCGDFIDRLTDMGFRERVARSNGNY